MNFLLITFYRSLEQPFNCLTDTKYHVTNSRPTEFNLELIAQPYEYNECTVGANTLCNLLLQENVLNYKISLVLISHR